MKTSSYLFLIAVFLIVSCTTDTSKEKKIDESTIQTLPTEEEKNSLLGEWSNLTLHVVMDTDPDSVLNITEGKWEEVLGIKPIRTTYNEDGTYVSIYENLEGQPFMTRTGAWSVSGDRLTMEERGVKTVYIFSVENDIATFSADLDWDEDGVLDKYSGTQKRKE